MILTQVVVNFLLWSVILLSVNCEDDIVFSFLCPFYSVTGDNKAGLDSSVVCEVWACPGQTIVVSLCEESVGDNYLRLYAGLIELKSDDDSCGELYRGARISYTFPHYVEGTIDTIGPCFSFDLYQVGWKAVLTAVYILYLLNIVIMIASFTVTTSHIDFK